MNIFEFHGYKAALDSLLKSRRKTEKGLSRKLAEHLGVHATMVSQVMTGTKDFTEEQMILVCEFLGVPKMESQYLLILLQSERAGSKKLKDYFQEQLEILRKQALQVTNRVSKNRTLSEVEKAVFYSSWLYPTIHLITTLDKKLRFEEICQRLNLAEAKVREILDFLVQIQMVIESQGLFSSGPAATHLEKKSPFLVKHHTNWRLKAIQYAETLSDQELMYSANVSISRKDFETLREEMMQMIQRFVKVVGPSLAEDIAQFNLDFFWIRN